MTLVNLVASVDFPRAFFVKFHNELELHNGRLCDGGIVKFLASSGRRGKSPCSGRLFGEQLHC